MYMSRFIFPLFLGVLFFSSVSVSNAYFTTAQEEFTVDGKTAVFVIDYAFGHDSYALRMPQKTIRGAAQNRDALSYEILDENGTPGRGTAVGIVLSDAPVTKGAYLTPKGVAKKFRLLVLYTKAENETGTSFRAQVTNLPFAFSGSQELKLNEPELRSYTTALVPLHEGALIQITHTETK